jgi:hypothetical protein
MPTVRKIRAAISAIPVVGEVARTLYRAVVPEEHENAAFSSPNYWEARYRSGGNSGTGSHGRLARFKAEVVNGFVAEYAVRTLAEFGCGDGTQLELSHYPRYTGIDVSEGAIDLCRKKFAHDASKQFLLRSSPEAQAITADLALSLDVIYHLVEQNVYEDYMHRLVAAADQFLCIYSSNFDAPGEAPHIRHHCFTDWIALHAPTWKLVKQIKNPFPYDPGRPDDTTWADFYFWERKAS